MGNATQEAPAEVVWHTGLTIYEDGHNVDCVHVDCIGGECRYRPEPPAIGPVLPRQVRDADGGLWTRDRGKGFFRLRPNGGYDIVFWVELARGRSLLSTSAFPFASGPWTVSVAS